MARKTLRVLCFGDSLTSGYASWGAISHPYALQLKRRLQQKFPDVDVHVQANGLPGDLVTFQRFENRLKSEFDASEYDWAIVLAGTNDLAYNISATEIFKALRDNWNVALKRGTKVLALTVPECKARPAFIIRRRSELNLAITTHQEPNYHFFDLRSHIPYHSLSPEDQDKYWDDGLHLTSDGYDWMGDHVATGFIDFLEQNGGVDAFPEVKPARSATKNSHGERLLDEEAGNPKNISEGYVVVRKRDLD